MELPVDATGERPQSIGMPEEEAQARIQAQHQASIQMVRMLEYHQSMQARGLLVGGAMFAFPAEAPRLPVMPPQTDVDIVTGGGVLQAEGAQPTVGTKRELDVTGIGAEDEAEQEQGLAPQCPKVPRKALPGEKQELPRMNDKGKRMCSELSCNRLAQKGRCKIARREAHHSQKSKKTQKS